jgi:ABC-2 type transport system permease protein
VNVNGTGGTGSGIGFRAGTENSSQGNELREDLYEIQNNFTMPLGNHIVSIGTRNEIYKAYNAFLQNSYGNYTYNTLADFVANRTPASFSGSGGLGGDVAASFTAAQLAGYADLVAWNIGARPRYGVVAVAIIASAFASLAISVGFDRRSGALLMLATTPLSRKGILGARALATMGMVAIQVALLSVTGLVLGWRPGGTAVTLPVVALLGTAAFAALGFALGGAVRAEATLAVANAAFLALVAVGGTTFPAADLPAPLAGIVSLLPSSGLADLLRWSTGAASPGASSLALDVVIVIIWGLAGTLVAARTFRWR